MVALGPPRRSRVVALGPCSRRCAVVLGPRLLASCCCPRRRRSRVLGPRRRSRVLGPGRHSRVLVLGVRCPSCSSFVRWSFVAVSLVVFGCGCPHLRVAGGAGALSPFVGDHRVWLSVGGLEWVGWDGGAHQWTTTNDELSSFVVWVPRR